MKHNRRCKNCGRFVPELASQFNGYPCPCGKQLRTKDVAKPTAKIPLVTFEYADSRTGLPRFRRVRVVRMDGEKIQGFEVQNSWDPLDRGQFKTFKLGKKLQSAPVLLEFIQ